MSTRVGHIMRHEDVHGVSGTGKVADVFEASNGKCVIFWISGTPSVNVFDSIKGLEVPHRHGGKTEIIWDWESEPDPDPMDALKKEDTGGEILTGEEDLVERVAEKIAEKLNKSEGAEPKKRKSPAKKTSGKKKDK